MKKLFIMKMKIPQIQHHHSKHIKQKRITLLQPKLNNKITKQKEKTEDYK